MQQKTEPVLRVNSFNKIQGVRTSSGFNEYLGVNIFNYQINKDFISTGMSSIDVVSFIAQHDKSALKQMVLIDEGAPKQFCGNVEEFFRNDDKNKINGKDFVLAPLLARRANAVGGHLAVAIISKNKMCIFNSKIFNIFLDFLEVIINNKNANFEIYKTLLLF